MFTQFVNEVFFQGQISLLLGGVTKVYPEYTYGINDLGSVGYSIPINTGFEIGIIGNILLLVVFAGIAGTLGALIF